MPQKTNPATLKNTTAVGVPTQLNLQFFKYWVEFLRPLHKINPRDVEVMAMLLYKRYQLSKVITDERVLDTTLMSSKMRKEIREELGLNPNYFQVILQHLRSKKAILGDKINPKFVPKLDDTQGDYKLIVQFIFNETDKV